MSNRKLVLVPFLVALLYATLPFPQPQPLPSMLNDCNGCNNPAWLISDHLHIAVWLLMLFLALTVAAKFFIVISAGRLPNSSLFGTTVPILWFVFFASAGYYLWWNDDIFGFKPTAYDFTSLIPFLGFAVVDVVFARRLRKMYSQRPGVFKGPIPFYDHP